MSTPTMSALSPPVWVAAAEAQRAEAVGQAAAAA